MEAQRFRIALVVVGVSLLAAPVARAVDMPVPAKVHLAKVDKNDGTAKVAKVVNKPAVKGTVFVIPTPGGPNDPTEMSATLRFCKLSAPLSECTPILLRSAQWKGLGKVPGSKGYKYKGAGSPDDPCKVVIIKPKVIKAVCKGPGALDAPNPFSLPIGPAGVGWELVVGDDRYCAESSVATGATVKKDDAAAGVWKAIKASAPLVCFASAPTSPTPAPTPTPGATPTPPYGSASRAFLAPAAGLLQ
jgi:hypothetical protein